MALESQVIIITREIAQYVDIFFFKMPQYVVGIKRVAYKVEKGEKDPGPEFMAKAFALSLLGG